MIFGGPIHIPETIGFRGANSYLALFHASLHPWYNVDDRCRWLLMHTLCAMHTVSLRERERTQHCSGVREVS
jgi:hypothetical protein